MHGLFNGPLTTCCWHFLFALAEAEPCYHPARPPIIIIDLRARHGPGIGGLKFVLIQLFSGLRALSGVAECVRKMRQPFLPIIQCSSTNVPSSSALPECWRPLVGGEQRSSCFTDQILCTKQKTLD